MSKLFQGVFGILLRHCKRIEGILPELLVSASMSNEERVYGHETRCNRMFMAQFPVDWSCCKVHEICKVGMRWLVSTSVSLVMDVL